MAAPGVREHAARRSKDRRCARTLAELPLPRRGPGKFIVASALRGVNENRMKAWLNQRPTLECWSALYKFFFSSGVLLYFLRAQGFATSFLLVLARTAFVGTRHEFSLVLARCGALARAPRPGPSGSGPP